MYHLSFTPFSTHAGNILDQVVMGRAPLIYRSGRGNNTYQVTGYIHEITTDSFHDDVLAITDKVRLWILFVSRDHTH